MASSTPKECGICNEDYNEKERRPRVLGCSHTLCSLCVENLIQRNNKCCPFCRERFSASTTQDIVVNRGLLDALDYLKDMEKKAALQINTALTPSTRVNDIKKYTHKISEEILLTCREAEEKLNRLLHENITLRNNFSHINETIEAEVLAQVNEMMAKNIKRVEYLNKQVKELESQKREVTNQVRKIQDAKSKLESSKTFKETGAITDVIEEIREEVYCFQGNMNDDESTTNKLKRAAEAANERLEIHKEAVKGAGQNDAVNFVPGIYTAREWSQLIEQLRQSLDKEITAYALYEYQARKTSGLSFHPGDLVTDIEKIDENLWRGWCNGQNGFFPAGYVQLRSPTQ